MREVKTTDRRPGRYGVMLTLELYVVWMGRKTQLTMPEHERRGYAQ
jgi:hypothetical protein